MGEERRGITDRFFKKGMRERGEGRDGVAGGQGEWERTRKTRV